MKNTFWYVKCVGSCDAVTDVEICAFQYLQFCGNV
jgi:hypothetical protein